MDLPRIDTALNRLEVSDDATAVYLAMLKLGQVTLQQVAQDLAQRSGVTLSGTPRATRSWLATAW